MRARASEASWFTKRRPRPAADPELTPIKSPASIAYTLLKERVCLFQVFSFLLSPAFNCSHDEHVCRQIFVEESIDRRRICNILLTTTGAKRCRRANQNIILPEYDIPAISSRNGQAQHCGKRCRCCPTDARRRRARRNNGSQTHFMTTARSWSRCPRRRNSTCGPRSQA